MSATRNKFSPEFRDRAVRMVEEHRGDYPSEWSAMSSIVAKVGCTTETLRRWCREEASPKGSWLAAPAAQADSDRDRVKALEREVKELRRANEILRKASAYFAQAERAREPWRHGKWGCRLSTRAARSWVPSRSAGNWRQKVLGAPSSYHDYAARLADPGRRPARARRDDELREAIKRVHDASFGLYGTRKVWHQLRREGGAVAKCTVERLMRTMGLAGVRRGKTTVTTVSNPKAPCLLDKVNREFRVSRPNALWVVDFT